MRIPFTNLQIIKRSASPKEISDTIAWNQKKFLTCRDKPMLLSTVYRCVSVLSDSVAMLPIETYRIDADGFKSSAKDHAAYYVLNDEPNENMTRSIFMRTMITSMLLTGNAYAYIERDKNLNVIQLIYEPSSNVSVEFITDGEGVQRKRYRVVGFRDLVEPKDMVHLLNFTYDGINGISTLEHARRTIGIAQDSEKHAEGFFSGGANTSGILTIQGGRLTKEQIKQNYDRWEEHAGSHPGGIQILEGNMQYQPITISPKDSQLLETREFNVVDICRFFNVSPVKAFDLSKSSYSTVEATQLAFLTDTLQPLIVDIELEINRKVFLMSERKNIHAEFNTTTLLRTDKAALSSYYNTLFNVGAATPNEIRRENNLPKMEGGDSAFVQVNVQTLKKATTPITTENQN